MTTQAAIWIFATVVGLLAFIATLLRRANAGKLDTFQTTVLEKSKQSVLANDGLFIPIEKYFIVVEGGYKVETEQNLIQLCRHR